MLKIFFSAVAIAGVSFFSVQNSIAADVPVKAPAYVSAPYNWTGYYVGANLGGGWGNRNITMTPNDPGAVLFLTGVTGGNTTSFKSSGVLGGLQLGYNWQLNRNWLVGIETDANWSGIKGSGSFTNIEPFALIPFQNTSEEKIKWFGTLRARLGYLPTDNLLAYVTGGLAYGRVERRVQPIAATHSANFSAGV